MEIKLIDDNINYEYIIRYIRDVLPESGGYIKIMEEYAFKNDVPISQPETIRLIEILMKLGRIKSVLEVGTAIGYSAIRMSKATNAKVDTVEIWNKMVEVSTANIEHENLSKMITVHHGDAKEILPKLDGEYDMIFIDAAKAQYNEFFPHCMRMLKNGGLIVSDNVLYKGMTATDELLQHRKRTIVKRLRDYLEMLKENKELDTVVLPVGDGVALSFKS
ncbi:MAG: O-methyltransferase [Oscillospiraceae bacterium]